MDQADTSQLKEFLEFIHGEQTGYAYCLNIEARSKSVTQKYFQWPVQCDNMVSWISERTGRDDVYYSPALFSEPSGKREHFKTSQVLWCEFDGNAPAENILQGIPEPTYKLQSSRSGYEHWYWRLQSPITDCKILEFFTARLAYALSADHVWNANRVLRPPGTYHHESGKQTQTLYKTSTRIVISEFVNLPDLPDSIKTFTVGAIPKILDVIAKFKWEPEAWQLFKTEKQKVGSRSSALSKLAMYCVEMGMSNAEILSVLYAADDRWEKFKLRGDRKERLQSLAKYARGHSNRSKDVDRKSSKLQVFNFVEFLEADVEFTWAIPNVLPEQGIALVAGEPGVGKTQFSLQTAIHTALGKQFINWEKPTRAYKLVILSLEMVHAHLKQFVGLMAKDLNKDDKEQLKENLHLVPLGAPLNLDQPEDQALLSEVMEIYKPDGVIIDSLGQAMVGLNDDENVNRIFGYLRGTLSSKYNAFSWLIHFPRKEQVGNRKPKRLDDLYGNRYIGGQIDTGLLLWKLGGSIEVSWLKKRLAVDEKPTMIRRTPNLNFEISGYTSTLTPMTDANKDNNIWGEM